MSDNLLYFLDCQPVPARPYTTRSHSGIDRTSSVNPSKLPSESILLYSSLLPLLHSINFEQKYTKFIQV